jgi:putative ABC transport system permease protein
MTALNRKLIRDLMHLRGQVIAVAMVVACGIAVYITMRSAYESLLVSQAIYYDSYRFAHIFAHLKRAPDLLSGEISSIPGVAAVQTRIVMEVTLDVPGLDEPATGRLISIPELRATMLNDIHLRRGNWVEPGRRDEVIISEAFADANSLELGQTMGAVINGRWERLKIVGVAISPEFVYEIQSAAIFPDNRRFGIIWMSREALSAAFDLEGGFNNVTLTLLSGASEKDVIDRLDLLLERYGGLGAYGRDDQISHRFFSDEITQDRLTGLFVPPIFLGVAAFLIHMVLSRLINTQRDQIAVLKAFGYGGFAIAGHYLKFALVPVIAGAAVGTALGVWLGAGLAEIYSRFFRLPIIAFSPGLATLLIAAAISASAALIGAVLAVRRVIKLPPAEAMRPEPPARFRQGWAERRLIGRLLSPAARMVLRNIERRPWKAALTVLGISMAIAILVMGRYFFDALDHIIEVQFRTVQREDVTVTFNESLTSRARYDVMHLPGVVRSEAFRSVPVRLRFNHRQRRLALLGVERGAELRRLLDVRLREVEVPPDGIIISSKLASVLGVGPGQPVMVEVLEGARQKKEILVVGLVDEFVGIGAYMELGALNRFMGEGGTISGAHLAVDSRAAPELYSLLKRTPAVGGVAIRETMIESFLKTVAESLLISMTAVIIFACVIAVAMVYNGARIALSERGRELASLRVLGFTRREVAVMLLGEQAVLTLLAFPLGLATGMGICALLVRVLDTELYRIPMVFGRATFIFPIIVVVAAALFSGLLVYLRIRHMDLVAVLKTRE